ncbi:MAG: serine protease, partial [Cylindrospermopsis raciborskii 1523720]|nr:serine protease [Cylindrospermopsis raciborskii]
MMRFPKVRHSPITSRVVAMFMGLMLMVSSLLVSPSQAQSVPAATAAIGKISFVTAAVNRVGSAVVRIDTEKTISRPVDPIMEDPFFRRFFGDTFPPMSPTEQL